MKINKGYIIFFSIVATYLIIVFILFGWNNILKKFQKSYIIIDPNTKWQYIDGTWSDMPRNNEKLYNWQTFKIYSDNTYVGDYQLMYNDKWYIFNKQRESIRIDGNLLAIRGNFKINVIDFTKKNLTVEDNIIIDQVLKEQNLKASKLSLEEKVEIDIDNDGKNETIYAISNIFLIDKTDETIFSLLFMKKNNKISIIYKTTGTLENELDYCPARIQNIIDIGNDKKYEIITSCPYFSLMGTCHNLYQLEKKEYKAIKTCQEGKK